MLEKIVASLSSIPPRFGGLGPTLCSLRAQTHPLDEVILWIPWSYRRFPDWDGRLPDVPEGVTILRCERDLGPATKILPTLTRYEGKEVDILFCDDDRLYLPEVVARLLEVRAEHPSCCLAVAGGELPGEMGRPYRRADRLPRVNREQSSLVGQGIVQLVRVLGGKPATVRSSGYADLFYGFAGALVRPGYFKADAFEIPPVLWAVDDVWLSGQLECNDIPIWIDSRVPRPVPRHDVMEVAALRDAQIDDHNRGDANRACIEYFRRTYGVWKPSLSERFLSRLRPMAQRMVDLFRQTRQTAAPRLDTTDR